MPSQGKLIVFESRNSRLHEHSRIEPTTLQHSPRWTGTYFGAQNPPSRQLDQTNPQSKPIPVGLGLLFLSNSNTRDLAQILQSYVNQDLTSQILKPATLFLE